MPERDLTLRACLSCDRLMADPAPVCPNCLGEEMHDVLVSGTGLLEAWTIVRRPAPDHAGAGQVAVGVVRLIGSRHLVSGRIDPQMAEPGIGAKVLLSRSSDGMLMINPAHEDPRESPAPSSRRSRRADPAPPHR